VSGEEGPRAAARRHPAGGRRLPGVQSSAQTSPGGAQRAGGSWFRRGGTSSKRPDIALFSLSAARDGQLASWPAAARKAAPRRGCTRRGACRRVCRAHVPVRRRESGFAAARKRRASVVSSGGRRRPRDESPPSGPDHHGPTSPTGRTRQKGGYRPAAPTDATQRQWQALCYLDGCRRRGLFVRRDERFATVDTLIDVGQSTSVDR